jgi:hypothetical protein
MILNNKKVVLSIIIVIFSLLILVITIFTSRAYYHNESSLILLHATVSDIRESIYDYILRINIEDDYHSNAYHLVDNIPTYGYNYSHYNCKNNSLINYNSVSNNYSFESNKKDVCNLYFNMSNNPDIIVKFYIKDNNTYREVNSINNISNLVLNNELSYCLNGNERINNTITYINNNINITTIGISNCVIYFDKNA